MGKDWLRFDAQRRWAKGGGEGGKEKPRENVRSLGRWAVPGRLRAARAQGEVPGTFQSLRGGDSLGRQVATERGERLLGLTLGSTGRRWAEKPWKRGEERAPVRRV